MQESVTKERDPMIFFLCERNRPSSNLLIIEGKIYFVLYLLVKERDFCILFIGEEEDLLYSPYW